MKTIFTILITTLTLPLFGQDNDQILCFKITYYSEDGKAFKTKTDTIIANSTLDIDFYKNHFSRPYYYPKPLINPKYKDTSIVVWRDTLKEKDYKPNWTYTTVYDRLSRATNYIFSGCMICSNSPFNVRIFYDEKNRPIRIEQRYGIGYKLVNDKLVKSDDSEYAFSEYRLIYDFNGNIIQLKCLKNGKLSEQIDKM